jgi:primosomal protein N' (replication factor Y)
MKQAVEVALPTGSLDQTFHYLIDTDETEIIGRRVLVPFGTRFLTGMIIDFLSLEEHEKQKTEDYELLDIKEILDEKPVFDSAMLRLLKWISTYYIAPMGETIRAALPPNISPKSIAALELLCYPSALEMEKMRTKAKRRAEIIEYLAKQKKPSKITTIQRSLGCTISPNQIETLKEAGYVRYIKDIEALVKVKTENAYRIAPHLSEKDLHEICTSVEKKAKKQYAVLMELVENKPNHILQSVLLKKTGASSSTLTTLIKKEAIEKSVVEVKRKTEETGGLASRNEAKLKLTDEQQNAVDVITQAIDDNKFKPFLLHGVTGSGKTLVYIHAIKKTVDEGKSALLLVPEISLTPQLIDRFEKVFPNKIAAIHSKLSDGQRLDEFNSILAGEKRIVIGARSAVFSPIQNLGLIIVDEEHELSYKQDKQPRYHGRDTALMRANFENAVCVLGSATPSFETMANALGGKYNLLEIKKRADDAVLPEVEVIDMLDARRAGKVSGAFSLTLVNEIIQRVNNKEGVILFLNRRGFAPILECQSCGNIPTCKHCDVTLTLHKKYNQLRCHYCGYMEYVPPACPECGGELKELGFGTQRVEHDLDEILKSNGLSPNIQRIDLDTTSKKGAFRKILTDFADGKTDILIGTQMVAKGLDFSRCTLVGVINADLQLFIEDFRSSERTFQLLTQVSGRAGRSKKRGRVIIQSNHPDNPAVVNAKNADFAKFFNYEMKSRQQTNFPPYSRFCTIEFSGKDYHQVRTASRFIFENLPADESIIKYPPIEPYLARVKDTFRIILPIKSLKDKDVSGAKLRQAIKTARYHYRQIDANKVQIKVDVDSYSVV